MKAFLYTLYFILFTCYASTGLLGDEPIEIEHIRAGFNEFYRPGYWCPVNVKVKTGETGFRGKVILEIDKNTYTQVVEIPPQAQREITWNVLIYSLNPHSQIIFRADQGREKSLPITLQPIGIQKFLIGVEKELLFTFRREFEQYSDAARHTHYFTFSPEDMRPEWQFLEAVDLLVISEDSLQTPRLKCLKKWAKSGLGNVLALKGPQVKLPGLKFLKSNRSKNPALAPEIYNLFERSRWANQIKYNAMQFLVLYLFITLSIFVLALWVMYNKWRGLIFWLVIIGGVGSSFGLLFGFCPITHSLTAESVHIVTLNQLKNTLVQKDFVSLLSLSNKSLSIPLKSEDKFIKPLFVTSAHISQIPLHYLVNKHIILKNLALDKRDSIVFKRETLQEFEGKFEVNYIQNQDKHLSKYRIINETNFNLKDCFLLHKKRCIWLGRLSPGRTVEVLLDKAHFTPLSQFISLRFNQADKKSRYQKRILEMYLKKPHIDKQSVLVGWTEKPPGEYRIIPYEETYPTLWKIPIIP